MKREELVVGKEYEVGAQTRSKTGAVWTYVGVKRGCDFFEDGLGKPREVHNLDRILREVTELKPKPTIDLDAAGLEVQRLFAEDGTANAALKGRLR